MNCRRLTVLILYSLHDKNNIPLTINKIYCPQRREASRREDKRCVKRLLQYAFVQSLVHQILMDPFQLTVIPAKKDKKPNESLHKSTHLPILLALTTTTTNPVSLLEQQKKAATISILLLWHVKINPVG